MGFTLRRTTEDEVKQIRELYNSAFPKEERAPFWLMHLRAKQKTATMLTARQDGKFAGFAYIIPNAQAAYLFYLAIVPEMRGQGIGTKILSIIKEHYKNHRLFLAREALDPTSDNYDQRVRRHGFYLRNGFKDFPCKIHEGTVTFEVMGTGRQPTPEDYYCLIKLYMGDIGKILLKIFPMELTNE